MRSCARVLAAAVLLAPIFAHAGPADYVYVPTVEYGEKEIDFKAGTADKGTDPRKTATSLGFGMGLTPWWFSEIYAKFKEENNQSTRYDAIEWENKFQLTETGKYPLDVGFLVEIEKPRNTSEGLEFKYGPLLQTEFGKVQINTNLLLETKADDVARDPTKFLYQWQAKYRWLPVFEFGAQGFGETGKWDRWASASAQEHNLGPAAFGRIQVANKQFIKYNAAWLIGTTPATATHTLRMQVEYEFY